MPTSSPSASIHFWELFTIIAQLNSDQTETFTLPALTSIPLDSALASFGAPADSQGLRTTNPPPRNGVHV